MKTNSIVNRAVQTYRKTGATGLFKKGLSYSASIPRKTRIKINAQKGKASTEPSSDYGMLSTPIFQINSEDVRKSKAIKSSTKTNIQTATWFVPHFDNINWGGIHTIFRFINFFASQGVRNRIVIYDNRYLDPVKTKALIVDSFPGLHNADLVIMDLENDKIEDLPQSDIAVATIWMSAYLLLRFNQTSHKYYFVQDYEPLFYQAGSMYALAESTYRFGFTGIVNTPGLLSALENRHAMKGVSFTPAVDNSIYFKSSRKTPSKKIRIFFYTRPSNPRNAFELCVLIMKELINKYGSEVEIVTAGAEWDESAYGLGGKIKNLGLIKGKEKVGAVYRSCHIGCVYMLSKHPSYQPFEFMASGMATVSNMNEDNLWFLKDEYNCLLAEPSPPAMTEQICRLIEDEKLRNLITINGQKTVADNWDDQQTKVWKYVTKK